MEKERNAGDKFGPYEALRLRFLAMIQRQTRIVKEVRSWKAKKGYLNNIIRLAKTLDTKDAYMRGHCIKVMKYSLIIVKKLGLPFKDMKIIKAASILHDIGKIGMDLNILRKTTKLTTDDWEKIKTHPWIGAAIVRESGLLEEVVPIIEHHHARYAGGGYPDPDRRDGGIPLGSRIIAVADAFDAMTSDRPYRKAISEEMALAELNRCSGDQFDPDIVSAFLSA